MRLNEAVGEARSAAYSALSASPVPSTHTSMGLTSVPGAAQAAAPRGAQCRPRPPPATLTLVALPPSPLILRFDHCKEHRFNMPQPIRLATPLPPDDLRLASITETMQVKHGRTETVGNNETITIGVNRTKEVGSNETITIGADRAEDVGADDTINIGSNRKVTVGSTRRRRSARTARTPWVPTRPSRSAPSRASASASNRALRSALEGRHGADQGQLRAQPIDRHQPPARRLGRDQLSLAAGAT